MLIIAKREEKYTSMREIRAGKGHDGGMSRPRNSVADLGVFRNGYRPDLIDNGIDPSFATR